MCRLALSSAAKTQSELLRLFFSATHAGKRNTEHFLSTSNGNTGVRAATCQKLTVSRTRHVEADVQPHVFIISRQDFFRVRRKARGNSTTGKKSAERMCVYITSVQNVIICRNGRVRAVQLVTTTDRRKICTPFDVFLNTCKLHLKILLLRIIICLKSN